MRRSKNRLNIVGYFNVCYEVAEAFPFVSLASLSIKNFELFFCSA